MTNSKNSLDISSRGECGNVPAQSSTPRTDNAMMQMACFTDHPAVECMGDLCRQLETENASLIAALERHLAAYSVPLPRSERIAADNQARAALTKGKA